MVTGDLRNQIDRLWDAFWSGGIANPLEVIEQITYLLFLRRLDELQTLEEQKAQTLGTPVEWRFFPKGKDAKGRRYADFRWSKFKDFEARELYDLVSEHVFPFLRTLGGDGSTYAQHMKDARFTIPTPALLVKVVDLIAALPMVGRDTKGDLYEYMLSKIATAGQNGQFRTPRHVIQLMVELTQPTPKDVVCDPACGTAGFLVAVGEALRRHHPNLFHNPKQREHFHTDLFHGFDFDSTMLRIGSMNLLLHGVEQPNIVYRDSLAEDHASEVEKYTLVLANPPFAGSLDYENTAKVRWNEPLTPADLEALEQMLVQAGVGTAEEIEKVAQQEQGLGLFVRSLVGLDRAAAKRAFSKFLEDRQLNAQQLDFVNLIVDHLTQCGWMRPEQLYSSPFTDEFSAGPNTVFTEEAAMQALISTLSAIRLNAAGA